MFFSFESNGMQKYAERNMNTAFARNRTDESVAEDLIEAVQFLVISLSCSVKRLIFPSTK